MLHSDALLLNTKIQEDISDVQQWEILFKGHVYMRPCIALSTLEPELAGHRLLDPKLVSLRSSIS